MKHKLIMESWRKFVNEVEEDNPCRDGYEMVGTKTKDGKEVPNCVPKEDSLTEKDEPIEEKVDKESMPCNKQSTASQRPLSALWTTYPTPRKALSVRLSVGHVFYPIERKRTHVSMCVRFWVTQPERPKGAKDEVKEARRALN